MKASTIIIEIQNLIKEDKIDNALEKLFTELNKVSKEYGKLVLIQQGKLSDYRKNHLRGITDSRDTTIDRIRSASLDLLSILENNDNKKRIQNIEGVNSKWESEINKLPIKEFEESFENNNNGWSRYNLIQNNSYNLKVSGFIRSYGFAHVPFNNFSDFRIDITFAVLKVYRDFRIYFFWGSCVESLEYSTKGSPTFGYFFGLNDREFSIGDVHGRKWNNNIKMNHSLSFDGSNMLMSIQRSVDDLHFHIDGMHIYSISYRDFYGNFIGFGASGSHFAIKNISIFR